MLWRLTEKHYTDYWEKAIAKEMLHVQPAFEIHQCRAKQPMASKWIPCHMIFDVKMDFAHKARFVAGGHVTYPPTSITYSSVVAHDSVCMAYLIAALNDLDILSAEVGNAYLNAMVKEKMHTTCGLEFGQEYQGCYSIICKALYGLKSSGAVWCTMFAGSLQDIGHKALLANPGVWLRPTVKPNDSHYYEYVFIYVNRILVLLVHPQETMLTLSKFYQLKEGSIGKPTTYLGAQIREHRLPDNPGKRIWNMSADKYQQEALHSVEDILLQSNMHIPTKILTLLTSNYHPELEVSPCLNNIQHNLYQQLVGIFHWAVVRPN